MGAGSGTGAGGLHPEPREEEEEEEEEETAGLGGEPVATAASNTDAATAGESSCAAGEDNRETSPVT